MNYNHITHDERYYLFRLKKQYLSIRQIAHVMGRSPSTISREIKRNSKDGLYYPDRAVEKAGGRKKRSYRKPEFSEEEFIHVLKLLDKDWSPEQISNVLAQSDILKISHETIYKYIWKNKRDGGDWYKHLRQSSKKRRKRYNSKDSRGILPDKRNIASRPADADDRSVIGHFEIDLVHGPGSKHCILTLVDRKAGYLFIGKLKNKTTEELNKRLLKIIKSQNGRIKTITADNGTEFHGYKEIEEKTEVLFYFANPYHSWERGTSENANGLIRQYLPKKESMAKISQKRCTEIAAKINNRPRKRYNYITPEVLYA